MEGSGALSMQSGVFKDQPYSFKTRFASADGKAGTNPEELVAAAHAGCFSMALSFMLGGAGTPPQEIHTDAALTMTQEGVHWTVQKIHLEVRAKVANIDAKKFQEIAEQAKAGCPISKMMAVPITMKATLL